MQNPQRLTAAANASFAADDGDATSVSGPAGLSKQRYMELRASLTFRPVLWVSMLVLGVNGGLAGLALWLLGLQTWAGYIASQLLLPIVFFQAFSILHDCGHGSYAPKSWQNTLFGHYASVLCFMPYFPWKYTHSLHHAWAGHLDNDPSLDLVRRWRASRKLPWLLRAAWRSWLPLAAAVQHIAFWCYPIRIWATATPVQRRRCLISVGWMVSAYTLLYVCWPQTFNIGNVALAIVIYLVAVELVNLPHHMERPTTERKLALWEQAAVTRSCFYPRVLSEFLVLNFNFHIEHHLFPALPWYRLRQARNLVKPVLGKDYVEEVGVRWNLKQRTKDMSIVLDVPPP